MEESIGKKLNQPKVGQFYTVNVDLKTPYNVYGGLQDNGVWMAKNNTIENKAWEQNGKNPWTNIMGGMVCKYKLTIEILVKL